MWVPALQPKFISLFSFLCFLQDVKKTDLVKRAKDLKDKGTKLVDTATNAEKDLKSM